MARVLLVDDDVVSTELLCGYLQGCHHEVVVASNAPEAMTALQSGMPFDVMILDYMMPGQSGLELLQKMGNDPALQRPAVIITSAILQGHWWPLLRRMLSESMQSTIQAFVDKPFTLEHIEAVLHQVLTRPRQPAEKPTASTSDGRIKILMVEDDETSGPLILQELRSRGYAAGWCRSGVSCWEAIGRIDAPPVDLLILDLGLPDMQGEDILRLLGTHPGSLRVRVIVVTGQLARGEEKRFLQYLPPAAQSWVSSILVKPFDMQMLHTAIEKAVNEFR